MPTQPSGAITITVLLMTWCINLLFGILIARATYRAMILQDANQYLRLVILNDSLDRIRVAVVNEISHWGNV